MEQDNLRPLDPPNTIRIPLWLFFTVLAGLAYAAKYGYDRLGVPDIPLCVVNTSFDLPLDILLDGKSIGKAPKMLIEEESAAIVKVIDVGEHTLAARDSAGNEVAYDKFTVEKGSHGFLWLPRPSPDYCFRLFTTEYGTPDPNRALEDDVPRDGALRPFPRQVTQWFHDNPKSVEVQSWAKSDYERALRRVKCS